MTEPPAPPTSDPAGPDPTVVAVVAARAADAKKASATVILDVGPLLGITDRFVITSGTNDRQVRTIAEEIELQVKRADGRGPLRVEGLDDARWVLMDYGDVVVHVFNEEARQYYNLERLWSDARRVDWEPPRREAVEA
ncbi:MAG TPA: ribosome silencing factor [Acidimicrobiales bacterium]|nr:ribosome silencing factor [Acidimicrobiales bacterium]